MQSTKSANIKKNVGCMNKCNFKTTNPHRFQRMDQIYLPILSNLSYVLGTHVVRVQISKTDFYCVCVHQCIELDKQQSGKLQIKIGFFATITAFANQKYAGKINFEFQKKLNIFLLKDTPKNYKQLVLYPIPQYSKAVFKNEEAETIGEVVFYLDTLDLSDLLQKGTIYANLVILL